MTGTLYLVPTPIGNLSDITDRCRAVLADADFIAAEDIRVSLRLLNALDLKKELVSYHEHNKATEKTADKPAETEAQDVDTKNEDKP
jgi:16S rRNA (cytidine1402-2'-O)-methyltransferase